MVEDDCGEPFWMERPEVLLFPFLPDSDTCLNESANALSRLVILLWAISYAMGYQRSTVVMIMALLVIAVVVFAPDKAFFDKTSCGKEAAQKSSKPIENGTMYYSQKDAYKNNLIERYANTPDAQPKPASNSQTSLLNGSQTIPLSQWRSIPPQEQLSSMTPSQYRFCLDQRPIHANGGYVSTNQALATAPPNAARAPFPATQASLAQQQQTAGHPKTKFAPAIVAPATAWDYWSAGYSVPSGINAQTNTDLYLSGYVGDSTCNSNSGILEHHARGYQQQGPLIERYQPENAPLVTDQRAYANADKCIQRPFIGPASATCDKTQGCVNGACGGVCGGTCGGGAYGGGARNVHGCVYNPQQLAQNNIPINAPAGPCDQQSSYNTLHRNMNTGYIDGPGILSETNVQDSYIEDIGVSYAQQFHPTQCQSRDGQRVFVTDPTLAPQQPLPIPDHANAANIFDPRSGGYGTSYRGYNDPMLGQPQWTYDDIDAVRRPNYIVRSKIDMLPFADTYGQQRDTNTMVDNNIHALVDRDWREQTQTQREELQERYMRSYNAKRQAQLREAPIRTNPAGIRGMM